MGALPAGTVTFLFTDIEGSTRLAERRPAAFPAAVAWHDALVQAAVETNAGCVFKTIGEAFCAAFDTAPAAVATARDALCPARTGPPTAGPGGRHPYIRYYGCMEDTTRTTIVLPRQTLRRAKMYAAHADKTLSQFITEALEQALGAAEEEAPPPLPIGKYEFGITDVPRRADLYAQALRSTLPS